jgi:hypothetical protein
MASGGALTPGRGAPVVDGVNLGVLGIGSGWALVALGVLMIFRGQLITKREAANMQRQNDAKDEELKEWRASVPAMRESLETNNHLIRAVLQIAEDPGP